MKNVLRVINSRLLLCGVLGMIVLMLPSVSYARQISRSNAELLDSLDAVLLHADDYVAIKERKLNDLKHRLAQTADPEQRFWTARELTEEYSFYDSDSTLVYADEALRIARRLQRPDWINSIQITRSYVLAATGRFDLANRAWDEIEPGLLPPQSFLPYYESKLSMQTFGDLYLPDGRDGRVPELTEHMLDSIGALIPEHDPNAYWLQGWTALRGDSTAAVRFIDELERSMLNCRYTEREDARRSWLLAALYEKINDDDNWMRYIILSSISDVRASVKEIASIQELASYLYGIGELERANNYISYALKCANDYKCRARIAVLSQRQMEISQAFADRNDMLMGQRKTQLTWLMIMLIMLIVAIGVVFAVLHKLRRRQRQLDESNTDLSRHVEELQSAREQLGEANRKLEAMYARTREDARQLADAKNSTEKHIADIFGICSENIDRLSKSHIQINRLIAAGQFQKVRDLAKTGDIERSELQTLYRNFDRIFISIYPNFVEDFNKLLRPDEQITLKEDEYLNTDLRIYALVRLGLNDSVKIARFLHLSAQTVYNIRLNMRKKAVIPREDFADAVQKLGKLRF